MRAAGWIGAWISSWGNSSKARLARAVLVLALCFQVFMINFGVNWLPQELVLLKGYQGSLRWDWNLYLQHYFHILGAPRREDWKQSEILRRMFEHAREHRLNPSLAVVPDLPRFSAANFHLYDRLRGVHDRVDHPQSAEKGIESFRGFIYVVMKEGEQGMPWTTPASATLNSLIVDHPGVFRLVAPYPLPDGDTASCIMSRGQTARRTR